MGEKIQKVNWQDDYSIGIQEIDNQHKQLVLMTNSLYNLLVNEPDKYSTGIKNILQELLDYTNYHFKCEETEYFGKTNYPQTDVHIMQHEIFINEVRKNILHIDGTTVEDGYKLYDFLCNWLLKHIAISDKDWADFILSKK